MQLAEIIALGEDSIAPSRDTSLLRSIVDVRTWVEFVCGQERWSRLRVVRECSTVYHLQIELVIFVELAQIVRIDQLSRPLIACSDAVVEVAKPDYSFVVFD